MLGSNLAFVNRNGTVCILALTDGSLRKVPGWNFPLIDTTNQSLWGFINELGDHCFVIGDTCLDITYKDQENVVGSISKIGVCGFIKFTLNDADNYELIILNGEIDSALSRNFSQGALTFGAIRLRKDKYQERFYVRETMEDGTFKYQEAEVGIQLLIDYFRLITFQTNEYLLIPNNNIYNININEQIDMSDLPLELCKYHKASCRRNWKKYGLNMNSFEDVYIKYIHASHCELCNKKFTRTKDRHMDHCHATGEFRNITCNSCNHRKSDIKIQPNNSSGYKGISKNKNKRCKQGFIWIFEATTDSTKKNRKIKHS